MKLKVCGMKLNTSEVATLDPDYLGFIFWEPSKRLFDGSIPELPESIKKVGVFVDATIEEIVAKVNTYGLRAVQLHGKESPEFCSDLKKLKNDRAKASEETSLEIIKVFSIKDDFDFSVLAPYENVCDFFLFDTKGKLPGGNGFTFCWELLKNYPSSKPYFLSGGIGLDEIEKIREFQRRPESKYCHAIDVNSKFESEPGLKDIKKLKKFKEVLNIE
ncbi:phosphoribosylanthranilate isomerase [Arenibacter echinorum]|uniref:N-(5'-phosphoribosyl)anthranilate isomerase n=1 Tax=Arenibacter echinorum TaxID=440515 RepID=A0A327QNF6_9FLAO|nr:phosphoribosylanthranilate isomerase [Arenibacter echinorum]RAJ06186.1 phosphoribosylanthranilate isomerase [Arenibacter echinorum]